MIILLTTKYNSVVEQLLEQYYEEDLNICGIQYYNYNYNDNINIDNILNPKTNIDQSIQNEIKDILKLVDLNTEIRLLDTFNNGILDTPSNILSLFNTNNNLIIIEENEASTSPYIGSSTSWIIFSVTILIAVILLALAFIINSNIIKILLILTAIIITIIGIILATTYDDTNNTITIIVGGGLSNRIRPIISTTILGMVTNRPVKIYMSGHDHMVYYWNEIFPNDMNKYGYINVEHTTIPNIIRKLDLNTIKDLINYGKIVDETNLPTSVIREINIDENDLPRLILTPHNFRHKNISEKAFIKLKKILLNKLKFNTSLQLYINEYLKEIDNHTYGVHIRGGDFYKLYSEEPSLTLWTEKMDHIIEKDSEARFFIASDSARRNEIRDKYKNRIISINYDYIDENNINKNSIDENNIVYLTFAEFISLANCKEIIGTSGSTFSDETYYWPSNINRGKSINYVKPKYKEDSRYAKF